VRHLLLSLGLLGCGGDIDRLEPVPIVEPAEQVVPGDTLPLEYREVSGPSNNNLDVVRHDGRFYLAVRTAPDHFASTETRLVVMSSLDEKNWEFEARFHLGTDLREPRFLSYKGRLFLYFALLGKESAKFEPQGMVVTERTGPAAWTEPTGFYRPGEHYIPWRTKIHDGRAYLVTYKDGEHIYDFSGLDIQIELLVSDDGLSWASVDPSRPVLSKGGGSETDFAFDAAGDLYGVIRNERGDPEFGWGSKICSAKQGALGAWSCRRDPKKYDSPAVFAYDGHIFLVGRRNLTADGNYQLSDEPWSLPETINNLIDYSNRPKHCALWQIDRITLEVRFLVDVPGWGDTCFPTVLEDPADPKLRILYNYSSPLDAPEPPSWYEGQHGETRIYRTTFRFQ
jgi:hypothetical protein